MGRLGYLRNPSRRHPSPLSIVLVVVDGHPLIPSSPDPAIRSPDLHDRTRPVRRQHLPLSRPPGVCAQMVLPLHVIAFLGCRRWCCHSVQDHRRKLATMTPMGVMSLHEGIAEVFLHCIPCPCCSTSSRSRIRGGRGCPRKGRRGDDGVANQWRLPIFIATTMAAVSHAF
jgi:hypothetical protein